MVRDQAMFGTGQLPNFIEDMYSANTPDDFYETLGAATTVADEVDVPKDRRHFPLKDEKSWLYFEEDQKEFGLFKRYLVPTAEVPLTNLVREQILDDKQLPLRFTAY